MCQMMSLDFNSKENSRNVFLSKNQSYYFWLFDRNKGRLIAEDHLSVKISYTCSLLIWRDIMWRLTAGRDSVEFDQVSLFSIS